MSSDPFLDALRKKAHESNMAYLRSAEEGLATLKKRPKAGLKAIMSALHGLKGDLGALGYSAGQGLVHDLESLLSELEPKIAALKEEDLNTDPWSTLSFSMDDAISGIHQFLLMVKEGGEEPTESVQKLHSSFGLLKLFTGTQPESSDKSGQTDQSVQSSQSEDAQPEKIQPEASKPAATEAAHQTSPVLSATSQQESVIDSIPLNESQSDPTRFFLLCAVGRYEYALPIDTVREVIKCRDIQNLPVPRTDILGLITLRGETLPVFNLPRRLALTNQSKPDIMVICQVQDRRIALPMDRADKVLELNESEFQSIAHPPSGSNSKPTTDTLSVVDKIWVHQGQSTLFLNVDRLVA